jgi:hypothetical protein
MDTPNSPHIAAFKKAMAAGPLYLLMCGALKSDRGVEFNASHTRLRSAASSSARRLTSSGQNDPDAMVIARSEGQNARSN